MEDPLEAFKWYMMAAKKGDPDAQSAIGYRYFRGEVVEKNLQEAFRWCMRAAEQGQPEAQCFVGCCYLDSGDDERAKKWLRKSAKQCHPDAIKILYDIYGEKII